MPIDLQDRKHGMRVAIIADVELQRNAIFVLAVNAQMPGDALRARFPTQVKIGPAERIRDLVNLQLPGVTLRALPVAPRQIPYHAGFTYFELETRGNELWKQLETSGGLAMHIAGDFPGLDAGVLGHPRLKRASMRQTMSDNDRQDPFAAFESDRTIIKPSAGRGPRAWRPRRRPRRRCCARPPAAAPARARPRRSDDAAGPRQPEPAGAGGRAAAEAAPRLRAMVRHPNPAALRDVAGRGGQAFRGRARARRTCPTTRSSPRATCCAPCSTSRPSSTPWGGSGAWSSQSLLVQFHNEGWGGEKVFQLLTRLAEQPDQHRNLLELVYVALSLGFEGRYKVLDNGRAQLDSVRERLAQMLRQQQGAPEKALSPQWQGVAAAPPAAARRHADVGGGRGRGAAADAGLRGAALLAERADRHHLQRAAGAGREGRRAAARAAAGRAAATPAAAPGAAAEARHRHWRRAGAGPGRPLASSRCRATRCSRPAVPTSRPRRCRCSSASPRR